MTDSFMQEFAKRGYVSATPDTPISEMVAMLCEHRIGAIVICHEDGKLAGIFSERDVVNHITKHNDFLALPVSEIMTKKVTTTTTDATAQELMQIMTQKRIRHIPITQGEKVIGIVSIGDVVKRMLENYQTETEQLKQFIYS